MSWGINLFMYVCIIIILPIMYFASRNEWKPKKNIMLGVTLPKEAQESAEVIEIGKRYRRELNWTFLVLAVTSLPALFFRHFSISLTWDLTWMVLALIAPSVVSIRGWKSLRRLKKEKGWEPAQKRTVTVDLSAMEKKEKPYSLWRFIPPVVIGMLPWVYSMIVNVKSGEPWWVGSIVTGSIALCNLLFVWMYRVFERQRAEIVDGRTELTVALTRVRRRNWQKMALWSAWMTAIFNLAIYFLLERVVWFLIATVVYTIAVMVLALNTEFTVRRVQERLTANVEAGYEDEDEYWLLGSIYYNPHDRHVMKNMRTGMNITVNLATTGGKIIWAFTVLVILWMPFMGVWMIAEEFTPVRVEMREEQIVVTHLKEEYVVDLEEIESAEVIGDLPPARKDIGTNMETLFKGQFRVDGYGICRLCLNPQEDEFLVIKTVDDTYIFRYNESVAEAVEDYLSP